MSPTAFMWISVRMNCKNSYQDSQPYTWHHQGAGRMAMSSIQMGVESWC